MPPTYEFDISLIEKGFAEGAKALILCNLSNPCGKVFRRDELEAIAALAIKYDAFVVTDEVYEHIVYAPSKIAFVHTLCTAREEKSTYIRLYKMFCQPNSLLGPQVWHPSRRFSG